jgi:hypothetical protein
MPVQQSVAAQAKPSKNGAAELGEKAGSAFTDMPRARPDGFGAPVPPYDSPPAEDYVRREPVRAVAVAATLGLAIGYLFAVRSAPQSVARRRSSSRWL